MLEIRKAERAKTKLRLGLSGPSGSGKTYSALLVARGLASAWEKILLIDTENGSGEMYSNLGAYNVLTLTAPFTPERYIEALETGEKSGMEVIVVDSVSHEWEGKGGLLEANEKLASAKFKGNTWAAWSDTTPRHQKFIEAIVTSGCHVITTARSKTDTIQTEDKKIKKVGLKDIQREGFEYELTVMFNIDRDKHMAMASKDRTGLFIDRDPFVLTEAIGKELLSWAMSGVDAPEPPKTAPVAPNEAKPTPASKRRRIGDLMEQIGKPIRGKDAEVVRAAIIACTGLTPVEENLDEIIVRLEAVASTGTYEGEDQEIKY